jgi:PAS domain S-box-containing protein
MRIHRTGAGAWGVKTIIRILLVDDEPMFLDLARTYLSQNGTITVTTALSAKAALSLLKKETFDVVVADYDMPAMNGIELLQIVKAEYPSVPFILFTGMGCEEVILEALNHGVDFYLEKKDEPDIQFAKLIHKIHRASARKRNLDALQEVQDRYRSFFDSFPGIAFRGTLDWRPVFLHGAVEEITGYTGEEFLRGRPRWDKIIHPEDRPGFEANVQKFREVPDYFADREFRIIRKDGKVRWLRELIGPVCDATGKPIGVQGAFYDISEQKEARKTRALLAAIVESTDDAIIGMDRTGAIMSWNAGAKRLYGYHAAEVLGKHGQLLIQAEEREAFLPFHDRLHRGYRMEHMPMRHLRKDGAVVDVSVTVSPIRDDQGSLIGASMIARDISSQKAAEEALRRSEERFQLLANKACDAIFRYELRPMPHFSYISPAIRAITGYEPDAYYQDPDFGLRMVHPDDRPLLEAVGRGEIPLGKPISLRWRKKDGSIVWTEERDVPIYDDQGTLVAIEGIVRDVTERKYAEEALRDREARLRAIFEAAVHVAFITIDLTDDHLRIIDFSPGAEQIFGYRRDEVIGMSLEMLSEEEEYERLVETIAQMKQNKTSYSGEKLLVRLSGEVFPAQFTLYPLRDTRGMISSALAIALDITEQKAAEASLRSTKQKMENIIEFLPDPTFVLDQNHRVIAWNRAMEELSGVKKEEMIGKGEGAYSMPIYGDRRPLLIDQIGKKDVIPPEHYTGFRREGETLYAEVYIPKLRDGAGACLLLKASPLYDSRGARVGAIESIRDITDLKQVEEALRDQTLQLTERVKELRSLFRISDCIEEKTGLDEKLACIADAIPPGLQYPENTAARITLDDREFCTANYRETPWRLTRDLVIDGIVRGGVEAVYLEERPPAHEGPFLKEESDLLSTIVKRIRKVVELKEAQEELVESEERLNLAIEGAHLGIWDSNLVTGEEVFNRRWAEMLGYSLDELAAVVGTWESLLHPDDRERAWEAAKAHFEGKKPYYQAEFRMRCKDGSWKWIYSQGRVMARDEGGRPLRMIGIHQDIMDIRQSRDALTEANRKLNLLASITRHDILNQITAALGYLYLGESSESVEEALTYLRKVRITVENIQREVEFTRDYHELGVKEPKWQRIDLLVRRAAEIALPPDVDCEVLCGPIEIFADQMLEKVFTNLMDNALRHGKTVDRIVVGFEETGEGGILSFEDNGAGVPAAMKERIFDRAVGLHTGFGLFLSKEILALTNILIRETGIEGQGARFEILAPRGAYREREEGSRSGALRST